MMKKTELVDLVDKIQVGILCMMAVITFITIPVCYFTNSSLVVMVGVSMVLFCFCFYMVGIPFVIWYFTRNPTER